jgi:hypothetical protein
MKIGDKVSIKTIRDSRTLTVARILTTPFGKAARLVDNKDVYIGQFNLATLRKEA